MLGRWRSQSAKHVEEERLNAERERSSRDAASPHSPDASVYSTPSAEPSSTPASAADDTPTAEPPATPASTASDRHVGEPASTPASTANEQPIVEQASTPASTANEQLIVEPASTPASTANEQPIVEPASTPASTANEQPIVEPASTSASAPSVQLLVEPASAPATPTSDQPTPLALDASTRVQRGTPGSAGDSSHDTPLSRAPRDADPSAPPAGGPSPGDGVWDTPTSATEHAKGLGKKPQSKILLEAISDFESDNEKQSRRESDEKKSEKGASDSTSKEFYASEKEKDIGNNEILTSKQESGDVNIISNEDLERNTGESSDIPASSESGEIVFMVDRGTKEKVSDKDVSGSLPRKSEDKNRYDLSTSNDEEKPLELDTGVKDFKQCEDTCKHSTEQIVTSNNTTLCFHMPIDDNHRFQTTPSPHFPKKFRKRWSFSEAREIYRRPPTRFKTMNYLSQLSVVKCLQRTYGAAKTNKVTGCAVSCMELGVYVAITPVILFAKVCDAPLLCADKVISKSVGSVARILSCVPKEVSCGIPGCNCENPVICATVNTQRKD